MRVVLDTSVLVSALISPGGFPDRLYQAWRTGRFELISSPEQMDEFRRVSRYPRLKPFLTPSAAGTMINEIKRLAVIVPKLLLVERSADPADNFILAIAQAGNADFLVARDKGGLLILKRHNATQIVTVQRMIDILEN